MSTAVQIVDGRSCKGCTLCCKVLAISELEKPRSTWCKHCDTRAGCKIHGTHPAECKGFYCGYLVNPALDERWAPRKCKLVLAYDELHAPRLSVHVDPSRPNAWRAEPYYSQLKRWAIAAAASRGQVIVWEGRTTFAILPDRDKNLGEVHPDQFIITSARAGAFGTTLDVFVVNSDDPRVQSMKKTKAVS